MSSSPPRSPHVFATGGTLPGAGSGGQQQQLAISNGVLLAAVIFLFMVVVFVFLLYLYAKRYLGANPMLGTTPSSSRFVFIDASPLATRGLPLAVLRALPVTVYTKQQNQHQQQREGEGPREALECAVCLSEVADGEKVRALPKCGHGFHVECIDMWFHSHDTCPLCRAPVEAGGLPRVPREEPDFPMFPTNVLFWGTHDDVTAAAPPPPPIAAAAASASSSASGRRKEHLVIDIPARPAAAITSPATTSSSSSSPTTTPLPQSRMADDMRSPVSARLRSLRRLLSRGKQAVVGGTSSYSSPRGDVEQGQGGFTGAAEAARPPKTPTTKTPRSTTATN